MRIPTPSHPWNVAPAEAIRIQRALAPLLRIEPCPGTWRLVAGIDVGLRGGVARAGVAVLALPDLELVERATAERPIEYPYVPGLLSYREAPAILEALGRLHSEPDVLMFDGQGYAHPRRMGIATHLGILLDCPSVGCAKSRLCGAHREPAPERGAVEPLLDGDEVIGAVVRTRTRVRPVYVSVGHRVDLDSAIDLVLRCGAGYRLPEPTRQAHRVAS